MKRRSPTHPLTHRPRRVHELGEDRLIHLLTRDWPHQVNHVVQGVGDDCAAITQPGKRLLMLLKTDAIVENVHFTEQSSPRQIGWKALARCASDIAASGGTPTTALITLGIRPDESIARLEAVYRGLTDAARAFDIALVGGETVRTEALFLSVAMTGTVKRSELILRSGARPGDIICVTGRLGGSLAGRHLTFQPRLREARWLAEKVKPSAMMDISDGLGKDLARLCSASRADALLDFDRIPKTQGCSLQQALGDGEDFELLFTVSPRRMKKWLATWPFPLPLTPIGTIVPRGRGSRDWAKCGYDHFPKQTVSP
jgi:thiamine-monophosphate kinase